VGHQKEVKPQPWPGNPDIRVQPMLPAHPAFDLAVNLCTFAPGAAMPLVETSISEHGLLLLKGQGICRLDGDYHPVRAGDAVWAAAYCSRWFAALGRTPAVCVHYHDTNRDPM